MLINSSRGGSGTSQMGAMGATIPSGDRGAQYAAELRILLVCLSESLGKLGQNGGTGGHIFHWGPRPPAPRRTAPEEQYFVIAVKTMYNLLAALLPQPSSLRFCIGWFICRYYSKLRTNFYKV